MKLWWWERWMKPCASEKETDKVIREEAGAGGTSQEERVSEMSEKNVREMSVWERERERVMHFYGETKRGKNVQKGLCLQRMNKGGHFSNFKVIFVLFVQISHCVDIMIELNTFLCLLNSLLCRYWLFVC